jgi:hypothetical protein
VMDLEVAGLVFSFPKKMLVYTNLSN